MKIVRRMCIGGVLAFALVFTTATLPADAQQRSVAHAALEIDDAELAPDFWIARLTQADHLMLDRAAIDAQNAAMIAGDPSMHDLRALPAQLTRDQVIRWIKALGAAPQGPLMDLRGAPISSPTFAAILANRNLDAIAATNPMRYGLVVHRAALRRLPSHQFAYRADDPFKLDRLQESALFPGDAVVLAHASRDGQWAFVISETYAAWIEHAAVAIGSADEVFGYAQATPFRIITAATTQTASTPEQAPLSRLQLDMGLRLPLARNETPRSIIHGQGALGSHVLELPWRRADGRLMFAPALLPRSADSSSDYLPLTQANVLRQAFKFLGERYGWGHADGTRDCSGFVSEVYRSFGLKLPRNTGDQAASPVLRKRVFGAGDDHAARIAALRAARVGDLVYLPGHVMLVIGQLDGLPWVIHDTTGFAYTDGTGRLLKQTANGVVVTPLAPLRTGKGEPWVDVMTAIVRIAADVPGDADVPANRLPR